jgi:hypothetical protein
MKQKRKQVIIFSLFVFLVGCSIIPSSNRKFKKVSLKFENCLVDDKNYQQLSVKLLKGYKLKKVEKEGFCEYRFKYKESAYFYVSTDIYSGSYLNSKNRYNIGINTYAISRSLQPVDTILNSGIQEDGRLWKEYILGDLVVGYINCSVEIKPLFEESINSLKRMKD